MLLARSTILTAFGKSFAKAVGRAIRSKEILEIYEA